jgi:small-conductance mechanosensitive channel
VLSLGLITAALTISLQDVARNFVGGLSIFLKNIYRVGDRIEIASKKGDVIDIGLPYTTIIETNEWISGDQHTGISAIPNGYILNNTINNYTKDFDFLWDEIVLPITYDSDWRAASALFQEVLEKETEPTALAAKKHLDKLGSKYYLIFMKAMGASTFMKLTDNWIELHGRYITNVCERRVV